MARYIDLTLLRAEATANDIARLVDDALRLNVAAVCVNPLWVGACQTRLAGSAVKVATVVGFPLGANALEVKAFEAARAVEAGADELDMVVSLGHVHMGAWEHVQGEIAGVVRAAAGRPVKVIIETAALSRDEIVRTSALAADAGAAFVKTSTGFHGAGGATEAAVQLIRATVGLAVGVKASGGIRDCQAALGMIAAGASRIGTSAGAEIIRCVAQERVPLAELQRTGSHASNCRLRPGAQ